MVAEKRFFKVWYLKERGSGAKGGDRQPSHEGGRGGNQGTRPSGTGSSGQSGDKSGGSSKSGGKRQ
jgi:hypothetical protein